MKAIIVGGGIVGLSSAYYLRKSGWEVTVIDKTDMSNNCSYGNMGYICPSHFVPLATPGIVKQGLKWMWNSKSPFYVQPRFSLSLFDWAFKFWQSATPEKVEHAAIPLRDIAILSQRCFEEWKADPAFNFFYERNGIIEVFNSEKNRAHARHVVEKATQLGLNVRLLASEEVKQMEPGVEMKILGGVYYPDDSHAYPNQVMHSLIQNVKALGVRLITNNEVTGFVKHGTRITEVKTNTESFTSDVVVIAAGSWSRELAEDIGARIPLMPGRGYSLTLDASPYPFRHPIICQEVRVAITPLGDKIRFGGTMEITRTGTPPRMNRVQGIIDGVAKFFPRIRIPLPLVQDTWFGYRPCSADGLPYIGRVKNYHNAIVATGHAMIGFSLGPATGKLVSEIANEQKTSMDVSPFLPGRF